MKPLYLAALCFCMAGICLDSLAQEMYDHDPAEIEQNRLNAQKADVIRFSDHLSGPSHWKDTLKGIGPVQLTAMDILLYRKGNEVFVEKIADYFSMEGGGLGRVISKPIKISQDTVFNWLYRMIDALKGEDIFPYVYQITYQGRTFYRPIIETYHSETLFISFVVHRSDEVERSAIRFNEYALDEKRYGIDPPNLNYPYNISTGWYKLYRIFQDINERYGSVFEFVK